MFLMFLPELSGEEPSISENDAVAAILAITAYPQ